MTALALRPLRLPSSASLFAGLIASAVLGLMIVQEPMLVAAAVFGVALAVSILVRPDLATFAVVFLIYTNAAAVAVKYHDLPYTAGVLVPGLVVVPVAFHLFRRRPVIADAATLTIVVFLFVQLVSTLLAEDKGHAFGEMTAFVLEGVAIYLLIRNAIRTVQVLRLVVWTMLLAGVFMAAVVIFQEVTASYSRPFLGFGQVGHEFFIGQSKNPRFSGPIGDPNYFAQILLVLVPLGLLRFFGERTMFLRLLAAGATGVIAFGLTLTFSRGAGVAFVVVLVMMTVFRYIPLYQLLIVVLGLVLLLSFVPAYKERVATLGSLASGSGGSSGLDQSLRSRSTEMKAAAYVFLDHPFVGVGPGSFPLYYQEYAARVGLDVHEAAQSGARRGEEARRESHNILLSIAADLGILGLVSFLAIVYLTFRRLNRSRKRWLRAHPEAANLAASFMLGLAAYLTSGLFLTLAFERYFWLILALAGSAAALDVDDAVAAEPTRERDAARPSRRATVRRDRPAAPVRRPRPERRPRRPVRRPEPVTIDLPLPEPEAPVEVAPPPAPPVEVAPPAPPVEVAPPAPPVEVAPPAPPVEVVPPAPPVEVVPPAPPVEVEPPAPPVEVEPPAPPVEIVPPAPPAEVVPPAPPVEIVPPAPPLPATVVIDVTYEESEFGATKLVEVPHVAACAWCVGTGSVADGPCVDCDGIGRLVSWTTLSVDIPQGLEDGERIPLSVPAGPDGDTELVYALVYVEGDPNDKIIRYVAWTELVGALAFIGYFYFMA